MTIKELKELAGREVCTIEYYRYRDDHCHHIHTDTIVSYDDTILDNYRILDYQIADSADTYNELMNGNSSDDARDWWSEDDKYVIAILDWDFYNDCPIVEK